MKKIAIIGCVGLPAKYGGWETLADQLTRKLNHRFNFTVFCSSKKYPQKFSSINGSNLYYINLEANGVQSIFYDLISILIGLKFADTLLILGVSGCIFLPILKKFSRKKIIVNIDGLEWRREKWGKFTKWFLRMSEAAAVKAADVLVSDNRAIQDYIFDRYGVSSVCIAYGGDTLSSSIQSPGLIERHGLKRGCYAVKVCRIEPENNIDLILRAFEGNIGLELVIIGNWSNSSYGVDLRSRYQKYPHIHLLDPIYDTNILNEFRANALIYIHGHSAGGTNPSLVEAMYLGLPIAAFDCDFNRETTYERALYFSSVGELVTILLRLDDLCCARLRSEMKSLADRFYTWDKIALEYAAILE